MLTTYHMNTRFSKYYACKELANVNREHDIFSFASELNIINEGIRDTRYKYYAQRIPIATEIEKMRRGLNKSKIHR